MTTAIMQGLSASYNSMVIVPSNRIAVGIKLDFEKFAAGSDRAGHEMAVAVVKEFGIQT